MCDSHLELALILVMAHSCFSSYKLSAAQLTTTDADEYFGLLDDKMEFLFPSVNGGITDKNVRKDNKVSIC